jgi:hypothetical protein
MLSGIITAYVYDGEGAVAVNVYRSLRRFELAVGKGEPLFRVLFPAAVAATQGCTAWSCATAAIHAFAKGWGWPW